MTSAYKTLLVHHLAEDERDSGYTSDTTNMTRETHGEGHPELSSPFSFYDRSESALSDQSIYTDMKHAQQQVSFVGDEADECEEDGEVREITETGDCQEEEGRENSPSAHQLHLPQIVNINRAEKNSLLSQISHFTIQSNPAHTDVLEITRATSVYSDVTVDGEITSSTAESRDRDDIMKKPSDFSDKTDGEAPNLLRTDDGTSSVTLPDVDVGCSRYYTIGEPKLRRRSDHRNRKSEKQWRTPRAGKLAGNRHNTVDTRTIYSQKNSDLWRTITTQQTLLPPLVTSPRFQTLRPEARLLKEKGVVMKDFFSTGNMRHFVRDRAIVPTVYRDFFKCRQRKNNYVGKMYTDSRKEKHQLDCKNPDYGLGGESSCEYCDVIGNRYCASCIEFKNRHFAMGYEKSLGPNIFPQQNEETGLTRGAISQLSKSLVKYEMDCRRTEKEVERQLASLALSPRRKQKHIPSMRY